MQFLGVMVSKEMNEKRRNLAAKYGVERCAAPEDAKVGIAQTLSRANYSAVVIGAREKVGLSLEQGNPREMNRQGAKDAKAKEVSPTHLSVRNTDKQG